MSICRYLDIGIGSSGFSSTCLLYPSLKGLACLYCLRFLGYHRQTCGSSEVRKHEEMDGKTGEAHRQPEVVFFNGGLISLTHGAGCHVHSMSTKNYSCITNFRIEKSAYSCICSI